MARRRKSNLALSGEMAQQALTFLVHEGKLAAGEIEKALKRREKIVKEIRQRLSALGVEGLEAADRVRERATAGLAAAEKASRPSRKRARKSISRATRKVYQAQGRYMAALRPLTKAARKQIKAIREKSGIDAAIAAAKRMVA